MSSTRWIVVATIVLVVAVGTVGMASLWRAGDRLATYRVERGRFLHRVDAEGMLVAETATVLMVPNTTAKAPMKIAWLARDGSHVEADQVVVRFDPTDMENELFSGQADRDQVASRAQQTSIQQDTQLDNLGRDAALATLQLQHAQDFQSTDTEIYSSKEIRESQIDEELASTRKQHAEDAQAVRAAIGEVELDLLDLERRQAELTIEQAEAGLSALEVRAPHEGTLVLRRNWMGEPPTVGQVAFGSQPIAEIPQLGVMKAQVYVLEADAGGVAVGTPAQIVLDAHPGEAVEATVRLVAAVAKRRNRWSPVQYFDVELELATTDPTMMKPGQRVRATLLLQDLDNVLAVPREAVFQDDEGRPFVYRRGGNGFESIGVQLGSAALGRVVVSSGIAAGDVLALEDPSRVALASESEAPSGGPGLVGGGARP